MQWFLSRLEKYPRRTCAAVLVACLLLSFWQIIFNGKTFDTAALVPGVMPDGPHGYNFSKAAPDTVGFDAGGAGWQISAETRKMKDALRSGRPPLWNPHQMFGVPLLHNLQLSALFPLRLPLLPIWCQGVADGYRLLLLFLAGLGTTFLLLELGVIPLAALSAGMIYMLSGTLAPFSAFSFIDLFMLFPWLLVATLMVMRRPKQREVTVLALLFGGSFLSAYPGALIPIFLTVVALAVYLYSARGAKAFVLALVLGTLIGSPMLFPALDNFRLMVNTRKAGFGLEHFPYDAFVGLWIPNLLSSVRAVPTQTAGFAGWIGTLPFLFAGVGLFSSRKVKIFFAVGAAVCLLKLAGLPPVQWLAHLPILSQPMYVRYLFPVLTLCLAVLAGFGIELAVQKKPKPVAVWSAVGMAAFLLLLFLPGEAIPMRGAIKLGLAIFWVGVFLVFLLSWKRSRLPFALLVALAVELVLYHQRIYNRRHDPFEPAAYLNYLQAQPGRFRLFGFDNVLFPPYAAAFGLDDIRWMNALYPAGYKQFINEFVSPLSQDRFTGEESPILLFDEKNRPTRWTNLMGVRYFLATTDRRLHLPKVFEGEGIAVYRNDQALARAFLVHKATCFDDGERAVIRMRAADFDPAKDAVLEGKKCPAFTMTNDTYEPVPIRKYEDSLVELDVSASQPGLLVLTDTYFEKWRAEIDGIATPIFKANLIFRAVQVPPGSKVVRFLYEDRLFNVCLWLSILTLSALLGAFFTPARFFR